tara:strand:+ start:2151 stop:2591 length:441 start_codon:yes stop_codon:yes gene_type:complete
MKIHKEVEFLINLVNDTFDLDIITKCRKTKYIHARVIFCKILKDRGYGCLILSKILNRNHATILNCFKSFDWFNKTDKHFNAYYTVIEEKFQEGYLNCRELNEIELKKDIIVLQNENKVLYLENAKLKSKINDLLKDKVVYLESRM